METNQLSQPMGQCEVTGTMVPEDELVTIQGKRVCAEGKAILLDRLNAGETMPGEFEKPTVGRRFGCIFLDGLIVGVPFVILSQAMKGNGTSPAVLAVVSLVSTAVSVIYFGQMHAARSQTLGKIAGKLRVVNLDGSRISFNTAYVRALAYAGPGFASGIALFFGVHATAIAGLLVGAYGLVNVLMALFDRNMQRALHDRIAGTRVIYTP